MRADSAITEDVTIGPTRKPCQLPALRTAFTTSSATGSLPDPEQGLRQRDPRGTDSLSDLNSGKTGADVMVVQDELVLQDAESRRQHLNHKVARTRIKAALYEFYRSLEMVKNYKVLNHTGFAKILKKFDKTAGWKASKPYLNQRLKPAYFMTSTIVQDLIKETEDVFIDAFEKGHRRRGMAKLRIPDSKNHVRRHPGRISLEQLISSNLECYFILLDTPSDVYKDRSIHGPGCTSPRSGSTGRVFR